MSYIFANPNPLDKMVGDCVVRAISLCEDLSWEALLMLWTSSHIQSNQSKL